MPTDALSGKTGSGGSAAVSPTTVYSISDLYGLVKKFDPEFTPAPEVNPAMLNGDGTPKTFYHGTDNIFEIFDFAKFGEKNGTAEVREFITDLKYGYSIFVCQKL